MIQHWPLPWLVRAPLERLSPTCLPIARHAQSSKHLQSDVLVEAGRAYATNAVTRLESLLRSL